MVSCEGLSPNDPSSFARPEECRVVDIHLNLDVNFEQRVLSGSVLLIVEKQTEDVEHVLLDIRDITVHYIKDEATGDFLKFQIDTTLSTFGSRLEVQLPPGKDKRARICIEYETSTTASALQWLQPEQTAGKKCPYMFSQCQAIHARSMLPCQDTPSVKMPYSAIITVPSSLVALMSAVPDGEEEAFDFTKKSYKFSQKVPIPSYLIALVVGSLESRKIGPRSHVWSEKEFVDSAAFEFSETEEMLKIAESLVGPYVWGVYDLLLLPPSFPFGGMENPCLTFVTPTLLAGDKSLADVVAHEIAHSWTGNLVTNRNFEHFWLNEGFTCFLEGKIAGRMHGECFRHFKFLGGMTDLQNEIDTRGADNPLTHLVVDLRGVNPDDAFSSVPYMKGQALLFYLEQVLGGPDVFEPYFKTYIEKYKHQSLDTETWMGHLYEYFNNKKDVLDQVDWEGWLHKPGMPPVYPKIDRSLAEACTELCQKWVKADSASLSNFAPDDIKHLSSPQIVEFLAELLKQEPLPVEKFQKLTEVYGLDTIKNSEIRFRWLRLGIQSKCSKIISSALRFVVEQGRMKFVRPLYRDLYAWEETRNMAVETFKKHKSEMMHVCAYTISQDLHLDTK